MPLHLLSKKSWNVYAPASIARVRADEAAAEALEAEHDQKLQEYDAARRLALLRGKSPPPIPTAPPIPERRPAISGDASGENSRAREDRRKRRKLAGEDDTDRDIRLAKAERGSDSSQALARVKRAGPPITDEKGNIQLFAPESNGREKNADAEAEKRAKERDFEDQYTMRFSNAAGFKKDADERPWYATAAQGATEAERIGKNAFGKEDPMRFARDVSRMKSDDPMAAMRKAQTQLKLVEKETARINRARERELQDLKSEQKGLRLDEDEGLNGFSLDASTTDAAPADIKWRRQRQHKDNSRRRKSISPENQHSHHHENEGNPRRRRHRHHHSHRRRSRSRSLDRHHRGDRGRERQSHHDRDRDRERFPCRTRDEKRHITSEEQRL